MTGKTGFPDRDAVLEYLHDHLIGPVEGAEELLLEKPQHRYLTGMLFPLLTNVDHLSSDTAPVADGEEVDEQSQQLVDDEEEDPVTLSGQMRPGSVGISFVITDWCPVVVEVRAGRYREVAHGEWQREQLRFDGAESVRLTPSSRNACREQEKLWDGSASLDVTWRPHGNGAVVTVVLVNRKIQQEKTAVNDADCLFQVELNCRPSTGAITRYPARPHPHSDLEAEELDLLYRNVPVYAVGHGGAAEWDTSGDSPAWVETSFLPVHVVPDVVFDLPGLESSLALVRLMKIGDAPERILGNLTGFVDRYEEWITDTWNAVSTTVSAHHTDAVARLRGRATEACERMRAGIEVLRSNRYAQEAFGLANRAMAMQMVHSRPGLAGSPHAPSEAPDLPTDYDWTGLSWRPFQLGFLLLTVKGVVEEGPDRDRVDLIWFPTGGGKTEAYLGLAAFTVLHRRLTCSDEGAGTTVITRYTLRLLTTQQFQRAATMIAACEVLRRGRPDDFGSRPISIGMWVGGGNSPNSFSKAKELLEQVRDGVPDDLGFQIELCPWCGTRIMPVASDHERVWGLHATNTSFTVRCVNGKCPFSTFLPMSSVDEDLYLNPPTMLVGTVDKFARTVWNARTGVFFGSGGDPGPSLIIQDEFHLISGPLGTIVGLYEAAFDVLMERNNLRPKVVAATATIRRADEQTRGVFGREVSLFPPAGVDAADSYFVRMDPDSRGRAYAGVMPQGHTPLTGLVHVAAAQLQAYQECALSPEALDAYSTLVVYHNSLRELGKTINLAHDDIPARLKVIARADDDRRHLDDDNIVELTSNVPGSQIQQTLDRLGREHDQPGAIAFLASTNMISVGVDVGRLGVMTVVGQPKTTAEYIQATSRVGRSSKRPGLVVTLYSPSKPRDRSHYESFVPYHATLYRSVEPSSVTPFSLPARARALHADLVVLVRHALGLPEERDAARFDPETPSFKEICDAFLDRVKRADPTEVERVRTHLGELVDTWQKRASDAEGEGGLSYGRGGRERKKLLRRFTDRTEGWPTLDSMRSVDADVTVRVRGDRT
jgi:hypothetical protein